GDETDHAARKDVEADHVWVLGLERRDHLPGSDEQEPRPDPERDAWSRTTRDDRGELVPKRGAAVAQAPGEAFGDQRGLGAVLHVVRNQGERDHDENDDRYRRRVEPEVEESPDGHDHYSGHVNRLATNPVRQVPEERDGDERDQAGDAHRPGQERLVELGGGGAKREYEDGEEIERCLLRQPEQRTEDDLPPVAANYLPDGRRLGSSLRQDRLEDGCLHDPEPDVETDRDKDDAEQKRDSPGPGLKRRRTGSVTVAAVIPLERTSPMGTPNCGQLPRKP